jgi:hypothetical protein
MTYELSFKRKTDYLYVQATGIRNVENLIAVAFDLLTEADKHGYRKIFVDYRGMTGGLKIIDLYTVETKHLSELWRTIRRPQVAVIDWEDNRERFEFMENVAVNECVNVHFGSDVDEVMEWLGVGKSPTSE